jgi:hypothetical protein
MAVLKMEKKAVRSRSDLEHKVAKRYFKELNMINREVGEEEVTSDELYPGTRVPSILELASQKSLYRRASAGEVIPEGDKLA